MFCFEANAEKRVGDYQKDFHCTPICPRNLETKVYVLLGGAIVAHQAGKKGCGMTDKYYRRFTGPVFVGKKNAVRGELPYLARIETGSVIVILPILPTGEGSSV